MTDVILVGAEPISKIPKRMVLGQCPIYPSVIIYIKNYFLKGTLKYKRRLTVQAENLFLSY